MKEVVALGSSLYPRAEIGHLSCRRNKSLTTLPLLWVEPHIIFLYHFNLPMPGLHSNIGSYSIIHCNNNNNNIYFVHNESQ